MALEDDDGFVHHPVICPSCQGTGKRRAEPFSVKKFIIVGAFFSIAALLRLIDPLKTAEWLEFSEKAFYFWPFAVVLYFSRDTGGIFVGALAFIGWIAILERVWGPRNSCLSCAGTGIVERDFAESLPPTDPPSRARAILARLLIWSIPCFLIAAATWLWFKI